MFDNHCVIDIENKSFVFNKESIDCQLESQVPKVIRITLEKRVTLPPNSETIIFAKLPETIPCGTTMVMDNTSDSLKNQEVIMARSVCTYIGEKIPLRVMNLSNLPKTLYKNTCAGTGETIHDTI